MKLSNLRNKTNKIQLDFAGEQVEVEYRVHALTAELLIAIQELSELDSVMAQVERVVARWEVVDDEGQEIPTSREAIIKNQLPVAFLTAVLRAVTEDLTRGIDEKNA